MEKSAGQAAMAGEDSLGCVAPQESRPGLDPSWCLRFLFFCCSHWSGYLSSGPRDGFGTRRLDTRPGTQLDVKVDRQ